MPTATMSKEKARAKAQHNGQSKVQRAPGRKRNPFMQGLSADFLSDPHPLEFIKELQSDEFAMEKCSKLIVEPLEFESEKEWLNFAKRVWEWSEGSEIRQKEALADELLAQATVDEELMRIVKSKLAALRS